MLSLVTFLLDRQKLYARNDHLDYFMMRHYENYAGELLIKNIRQNESYVVVLLVI